MARIARPRTKQMKDKINDLYFVKRLSIGSICAELKITKQTVSSYIEDIFEDRRDGKYLKTTIPEISDEQVLKQNDFITKHTVIKDKYAEPILLTNKDKVLRAYNKMINNNFKTIG